MKSKTILMTQKEKEIIKKIFKSSQILNILNNLRLIMKVNQEKKKSEDLLKIKLFEFKY